MSTTSQSLSARLAQQRLVRGQAALRAGRRDEAVAAFRQAVAADPYHVDSLLWLAGMCDDPHESMRHLTRVLALDPRNESAHEGIRWARKRLGGEPESPRSAAVPGFVPAPAVVPAAPSGPLTEANLQPLSPVSNPAARSLPQRFMATRFAAPLFAMAFGLWLVLIAALSGAIVWMLLHPAMAITGAPVVAQAVAEEPQSAAAASTLRRPR